MIAIVWEFIVKDEAVPVFQRAYGPSGEWAALFQQHPGYEGTTLLQDTTTRGRFLTIDRWQDEAQFNQMHRTSQQAYARLDTLFAELTLSERQLGVFHWEA
jgi:heme-degrading monooxygenase HmoA